MDPISSSSVTSTSYHMSDASLFSQPTHSPVSASYRASGTSPSASSASVTSTRDSFIPSLDPLTGKPHPHPYPAPDPAKNSNTSSDPLASKALASLVSSLPTYLAVGAIIVAVLCVLGVGGWWFRRRRRRRRFISFVGDLESTGSVNCGSESYGSGNDRGDNRRGGEIEEVEQVDGTRWWSRWRSRRPVRLRYSDNGHASGSSSRNPCEPSGGSHTHTTQGIILESPHNVTCTTPPPPVPHLSSEGGVYYPSDREDEKTLCGSPAISEDNVKLRENDADPSGPVRSS
ncbi:hypothetical protein I317_00978 [Kwoniella heveanensis CBS 569]|nr:hypothetical protein I317_00978 [Kwoniella heveanensis CBS 569]